MDYSSGCGYEHMVSAVNLATEKCLICLLYAFLVPILGEQNTL